MTRRGGKRTVTISVTIGDAEAEMLREIVEACGFLTTSEAVRAMIRHYHEAKLPTCDRRREAL
jgi:Arc/MetJ-type ribon-helix-helix transcriptional regulator